MGKQPKFGLALKNFTPSTEEPNINDLITYAERAEALGYDSLWVWDHILLGSKRPFPFLESLSTLAALAVRTQRVQLGTGILVLPLRDPVLLAKVTSTIDHMSNGRLVLGMAAGWYEKEFEATGVPFNRRGAIYVRNLEVLKMLWSGEQITAEVDHMVFKRAIMLPKPKQQPRPTVLVGGYADRVLQRAATIGDGWLTYFYAPDGFKRAWTKVRQFAEEAGRDPDTLLNVAQLAICVASSFEEADRRVRAFIDAYFDIPAWSDCTIESAIRGTPEQCAEQIQQQLDAGVQHICFVPCDYDLEQVERIAAEVLPKVRS